MLFFYYFLLDVGPPYWNGTIPLPPQEEAIRKYFINSLVYSTNSALFYLCLDQEDNEVKIIKFKK